MTIAKKIFCRYFGKTFLLIILHFISTTTYAFQGNILEAHFDTGTDGFTYVDDAFRATNQPAYASGIHINNGGFSGGALQVDLGGINGNDILNMSGGWRRSFVVNSQNNVVVIFRYNLIQSPDYESDEVSQVLLSINGTLYGTASNDYVDTIVGDGNGGGSETTGWKQAFIYLGSLTTGTHTLTIGGFNNKKTTASETTQILIDDVVVVHSANVGPIADTGGHQSIPDKGDDGIETVTLDGSGSYDPDGSIVSYEWSENGNPTALGEIATVDLAIGLHKIMLKVTDDSSSTGTDEGTVIVTSRIGAKALVNSLDLERFKLDIKTLSDFGDRSLFGAGSPSFTNAQNWVQEQLEAVGYTAQRLPFTFQGFPRDNIYFTKVGSLLPDLMYIISAHLDGRGGGGAADDNGSGSALVLNAARAFAPQNIETDISVRFIFWSNEETGLNGSNAYVNERAALQGLEDPAGSQIYPEPTWLGIIQHDMILFDHGIPPQAEQIAMADIDIEYLISSSQADRSLQLANTLIAGNQSYSTDYPAEIGTDMCCTDSMPFRDFTASVSIRENRRRAEIGNGSNPQYHQPTDLYQTYSEADFRLGFNALQMTVGTVAELVGAKDISTAVSPEIVSSLYSFKLEQNYPNPFNPQTIIKYSLKEPATVQLTIYNTLGQELVMLVNAEKPAGIFEVKWDGMDDFGNFVSAGIYFYKIIAGKKFSKMNKMLLLK